MQILQERSQQSLKMRYKLKEEAEVKAGRILFCIDQRYLTKPCVWFFYFCARIR